VDLLVRRWRQYVSPKHWHLPTSPHGIPTQKTNIFTNHVLPLFRSYETIHLSTGTFLKFHNLILFQWEFLASHWNLKYRYGQPTWHVSDSYKQLITAVVDVLAMPCWKHWSQVSVLDSSSSRAVESTVRVMWTLFVLRFCFIDKEYYFIKVFHFLR
jgi:hypothetical protein